MKINFYNQTIIKTSLVVLTLLAVSSAVYGLDIAAVQLHVELDDYSSPRAFSNKVESVLENVLSTRDCDLVIFPEYVSVFFVIFNIYDDVASADTVDELDELPYLDMSQPLSQFFSQHSTEVKQYCDTIWGSLAEEYNIYIVGGSAFLEQSGRLFNSLLLYGPEGDIAYSQQKVYLTDVERNLIGLTAGTMDQQFGYTIEEKRLVFTICRDTYYSSWEQEYQHGDVWIDIKANGQQFNQQQKASFSRALPARLPETPIDYGITVCLTGEIFNFFWEGRSSVIQSQNKGIQYKQRADDAVSEDVLYLSL